MHLFLSFVNVILSLYYLGVMADNHNTDLTSITPAVALLLYSMATIIRELKRSGGNWLLGEETTYDRYNEPYDYSGYNRSTYKPKTTVTREYDNDDWFGKSCSITKNSEKTEYFAPDVKKKNIDDEKELVHYPSHSEVRQKIAELEKSRWFRIERSFAGFFGIDITEKYYRPTKTKAIGTVKPIPINKEDNSRYMPNNSYIIEREMKEYNEIVKYVGRSCEIAINDEPLNTDENNDEQ